MPKIEDFGSEEFSDLSEDERKLSPSYFMHEVASLQMKTRLAASVTIDLRNAGPLYVYAIECRKDALRAMQELLTLPPGDETAVARAQDRVNRFIDVLGFIGEKLHEGQQADTEITERWGEEQDDAEETSSPD